MNKKLRDIAQAIQEYTKNKVILDEVPEEWWTAEDYMRANNISKSTAHRHINALYRKGTIERRNFKIRSGLRIYPVPHFRNAVNPKTVSKTAGSRR